VVSRFLRLLGLLAAVVGAASLFRPVAYELRTLPAERALAKDIVSHHGRSALDFFKLWRDKSYFFSGTRRTVIAYHTAVGVVLCLGDPVGPGEELEDTVRSFLRLCKNNAWRVAFYQVLPDLLPLYARLGFAVLKIGEVAVVDLDQFATQTVERREFRRARRRFREERGLHQFFEHLNRYFSYKGLRHYKAKFAPAWESRFLVYQGGPSGLVQTALALARATEG
jgi:phosphatidylglycerol lysyltransferase